ncbi:MAG: hypothetical protein EXR71_11300 [Myxococcales bacterium]|nr:hypothetical protein [Myxococcales bacterium]
MKLLLPVGVLVFAAGFCCCGGDLETVLREAGIDIPNAGATDGRVMFPVPGNERVQILEVASDDAYYTDRDTIVGLTCTTDGESTHQGEGWHGGSVKDCDNGNTYYFYKAAYLDQGPAPAVAVVPALPGLRATRPLPSGARVKVLDVHAEDAFFVNRTTITGKTCRLEGESTLNDGEWHGGQVYCDDGSSYYFYKAAYEELAGGTVSTTPVPAGVVTTSLPAGSRVRIADVASDDAYFPDKATIVGKLCTLSEESSFKDGMWHGGNVNCDDASSYYFHKAAYELSGGVAPAAPPPNALDYSLPKGTRIIIADVATDDAYSATKSGMIGKRCTMDEQSVLRDVYWHGGNVVCDDGSSYYFYKGAFQAGG